MGKRCFFICRLIFVVNEDGGVVVKISFKKLVLFCFVFFEFLVWREICLVF